MDKVQDTIPINVCQFSQRLALAALTEGESKGGDWVRTQVRTLQQNRDTVWEALGPTLQQRTVKTKGAFYFFVNFPEELDDFQVAKVLVEEYGVRVLPGSSFGAPHHLRISYGNLKSDQCKIAAARLKCGLETILSAPPEHVKVTRQ